MTGMVLGDAAQCESRVGACMRLDQLPAMPNLVVSFLPPSFVNLNPEYPRDAGSITGTGNVDVRTAQPPGDATAITSHSFVQMYATSGLPFGVHVTTRWSRRSISRCRRSRAATRRAMPMAGCCCNSRT